MRKTEILKLIDDGQERVFRITQMPATKAERWANKAAFLLVQAGKNIKNTEKLLDNPDMDEIIKALASLDYDKVEPLYNELIECCEYLHDGNPNSAGIVCTQNTIDAQIVDPLNLYKLRLASLKLNFSFFMGVLQFQAPKNDTIVFSKTTRRSRK